MFNRFYRWSLIVALLLFAVKALVGSYGAPVLVPDNKAISTAFCGIGI